MIHEAVAILVDGLWVLLSLRSVSIEAVAMGGKLFVVR